MTTRQKVAALTPLVERMHRGHCWVKTAEGPRCIDQSFTEFMLAEHCAGRKAYGLAFVAPGQNTCRAALLDFDSHGGEVPFDEMLRVAMEVKDTAALLGLDGVAFRSSGGRGIHLYFLWNEVQDANSVRELLRSVLDACGLKPGTKGVVAKEVEVFPKQSSVARDGYGSMAILPLAGESVLLGEEK